MLRWSNPVLLCRPHSVGAAGDRGRRPEYCSLSGSCGGALIIAPGPRNGRALIRFRVSVRWSPGDSKAGNSSSPSGAVWAGGFRNEMPPRAARWPTPIIFAPREISCPQALSRVRKGCPRSSAPAIHGATSEFSSLFPIVLYGRSAELLSGRQPHAPGNGDRLSLRPGVRRWASVTHYTTLLSAGAKANQALVYLRNGSSRAAAVFEQALYRAWCCGFRRPRRW